MDKELKELGQFYGTERYHKVLGSLVTDGVAYIMENGYSWFVTDMLVVARSLDEPFLSINLRVNVEENRAVGIITDGNNKVLHEQRYEYTDAKVNELKLFMTNNVLMLSSEY